MRLCGYISVELCGHISLMLCESISVRQCECNITSFMHEMKNARALYAQCRCCFSHTYVHTTVLRKCINMGGPLSYIRAHDCLLKCINMGGHLRSSCLECLQRKEKRELMTLRRHINATPYINHAKVNATPKANATPYIDHGKVMPVLSI